MQPIPIALAVAALSLATPAPAQWGQDRTYSHQLRLQIDLGVSQGTISRRQSVGLREGLRRLVRLERRFSPNGISGREYSVLMRRSAALEKDIRSATRNVVRRVAYERRLESLIESNARRLAELEARIDEVMPSTRERLRQQT
jgi:hypothetical protein